MINAMEANNLVLDFQEKLNKQVEKLLVIIENNIKVGACNGKKEISINNLDPDLVNLAIIKLKDLGFYYTVKNSVINNKYCHLEIKW